VGSAKELPHASLYNSVTPAGDMVLRFSDDDEEKMGSEVLCFERERE